MGLLDRIGYGLGSVVGSFARGRMTAMVPGNAAGNAAGKAASRAGVLRAGDHDEYKLPDLGFAYNQQDLYQRLTWLAISISIVAEQAAGKTFHVKRMVDDQDEDIPHHEYELLHEQPNELETGFEFWRSLLSYRKLTGNGYAWLNRTGPEAKPDEMWVIPSHQIEPIPDGQLGIRGYMYYPNGAGDEANRQPLQPWEVLHLKGFNSMNRYVGLSDISQLAVVAESDLSMQKYNRDYFQRDGGRIPGVLAFADPIDDVEWAVINADVKDADKKQRMLMLRNAGKGGVEWVATAMSRKDMEFLAGRKANKEEIYEMIAPGLVSWLSMSSTEANSRSGRDAFYELAVWPRLKELQAKITADLLPVYGKDLKGEYEGVRPRDEQRNLQEQLAYERTHTVDEVRAKFYREEGIGDERGDLIARVAGGAAGQQAAGIEGLEEPVDELGRKISAGKAKTVMPAKAAEIAKFRAFVKRRQAEGKPDKIGEFEFKELDEAEQTALKAEVLGGDHALKARLQALIDDVREETP